MKKYTQHIDDLLVKQLTGEATDDELVAVEQWLATDKANQHYYNDFKLIWEESSHLAATTVVDEQAAWERFQNHVQEKTLQAQTPAIWSMQNPLMRAAIVTGLVIGIACLTYFLFNNNPGNVVSMATIQANEEVRTDSLPDGSMVFLNKHSQIAYPRQFSHDKRILQLNGEAFFKVTPNKQQPFEVHTNHVTITVVGTSFNVRSRGDTTEIVVETGIVQVATEQQTITLKAGEKALAGPGETIFQKQVNNDHLYNYYRSRKFICDNTPLWKLAEKLEEAYNVHIVFENDTVRDMPISTVFDNMPLEGILTLIRSTLDISVTNDKGQITLR